MGQSTHPGFQDCVTLDHGPQFKINEFRSQLSSARKKFQTFGVESNNALGNGERYQDFFRSVFNKIRDAVSHFNKLTPWSSHRKPIITQRDHLDLCRIFSSSVCYPYFLYTSKISHTNQISCAKLNWSGQKYVSLQRRDLYSWHCKVTNRRPPTLEFLSRIKYEFFKTARLISGLVRSQS